MSGGLAADARLVAEILSAAEGAALRSGSKHIEAEHLLIGCLTTTDPSARSAVAADAVDDRAVSASLAGIMDRDVLAGRGEPSAVVGGADSGADPDSDSDPDGLVGGAPTLSAGASAVLRRARELSRSRRPRALSSSDVLLAVAELVEGRAAAVLDDLRVDRGRLFDFRDWAAGR